jgi:hypothetical protein
MKGRSIEHEPRLDELAAEPLASGSAEGDAGPRLQKGRRPGAARPAAVLRACREDDEPSEESATSPYDARHVVLASRTKAEAEAEERSDRVRLAQLHEELEQRILLGIEDDPYGHETHGPDEDLDMRHLVLAYRAKAKADERSARTEQAAACKRAGRKRPAAGEN